MWLYRHAQIVLGYPSNLGVGPVSMQNRCYPGVFRLQYYRKTSISLSEQKGFICHGRLGKTWVKCEDARHAEQIGI